MATMTLHIPNSQIGWFEQMVQTMGWTFEKKDVTENNHDNYISPAMHTAINNAREEAAKGETVRCATPEEMKQYFDSL